MVVDFTGSTVISGVFAARAPATTRWRMLCFGTLLFWSLKITFLKMAPILWHLNTVVFEYGPFSAVFICLFLAVVYVGSLYVWTKGLPGWVVEIKPTYLCKQHLFVNGNQSGTSKCNIRWILFFIVVITMLIIW